MSTIATGLEVPWDIAFLPDGRALVTERAGRVRLLSSDRRLRRQPLARIRVSARGEGGLLGVAIDPRFGDGSDFVYLYFTTASGMKVAQDRRSRNGKYLRLDPREYRGDGGTAEIFSLGHRNAQGFDWQPRTGRLFSTEHGPDGDDEVNLVTRGGNYGWPRVRGRAHPGFRAPLLVYPESIAPSGATFVTLPGSSWTGDYLFAALRGAQLRRVRFDGRRPTLNRALFTGRFGRLRTVVEAPDGSLFVLTSNRDGRGSPDSGDDRILHIVPPRTDGPSIRWPRTLRPRVLA